MTRLARLVPSLLLNAVTLLLASSLLVAEAQPASSQPAPAQPRPAQPAASSQGKGAGGYTPHPFRLEGKVVVDDARARKLVEKILAQYGLALKDDEWLIGVTESSEEVPNAVADIRDNRRIIYFNRAFIESISRASGTDWALYTIAAHEVAHHLANHVLRRFYRTRPAEREADYHAGFVVSRMGAPFTETVNTLRWLPGTDSDYPSRAQRLCELGRGWRDAKRLEAVAAVPEHAGEAATCDGGEPDPRRFKVRSNRDLYGSDLPDVTTAGRPGLAGIDIAACAAACDKADACKAFVFDRWRGWCFLKSEIKASNMNPYATLGVKQPGEVPNVSTTLATCTLALRGQRFHDKTIPGGEPREAQSLEDCEQRCATNRGCIAASYHKLSRLCSLHGFSEGHYVDRDTDSIYKIQLPNRPAATSEELKEIRRCSQLRPAAAGQPEKGAADTGAAGKGPADRGAAERNGAGKGAQR